MSTPEEVSGSHALTTSEQLFCTLTAWHERVSVYIKGGVANVVGAQWKVYAINGSQKTLLYTGTSKTLLNELVTTGVVPGQGDTIALYGVNPFGATASVKAYMVGWDPSAAVSPVQASDVAGITLTLAEQDVCTLTGGYVNLDVAFNANGDPLAGLAQIRLYALLGGADRFQLEQFQIPTNDQGIPATGSVNLIQDYLAGATEFILTAQGRYGTSAVTVTGVLEGETGSAGAGGGGGPPVGSYWPTQTTIPATVTNPELAQAAQTNPTAAGPQIIMRASAAGVGGGNTGAGGTWLMISGKDGAAYAAADQSFIVAKENVIGGVSYPDIKGLFDVYYLPGGAVAGIGGAQGDDGLGLNMSAWQIASYRPIEMASHQYCQVATIQGANIALWDIQNVDDGFSSFTGIANRIQYTVNLTSSTDDAGVSIQRSTASTGGLVHRYLEIYDGIVGVDASPKRKWDVEQYNKAGTGGGLFANVVFYGAGGTENTTATEGFIRLPHSNGATFFKYLVSTDLTESVDLDIVTRVLDALTFGNINEEIHYNSKNLELHSCVPGGNGWQFNNTLVGQEFAIHTDGSYVQGEPDTAAVRNGVLHSVVTSHQTDANTDQVIASIPLQDGAFVVTELEVHVQARLVGGSDFCAISYAQTYLKNSGTVTHGTGGPAVSTYLGGSALTAGQAITFVINGGNIDVHTTPWTASAVGWAVSTTQRIAKQDS